MSLRHYKSSNREIQELAHGFESHASVSSRFKSDVNSAVAGSLAQQAYTNKQSEAAALRLEAGRKTRDEMMRSVERQSESSIGRALETTFRPIQKLLRKDEIKLDDMYSRKKQLARETKVADDAANKVVEEMKAKMRTELNNVLHKRETELEHHSMQYLTKVHAKVPYMCPCVWITVFFLCVCVCIRVCVCLCVCVRARMIC